MFELLIDELVLAFMVDTIIWVSVFVFVANVITIVLPNKSRYRFVQRILDMLNIFAMNIMRNANRLYPQRFPSPKKRKKKVVEGDDDSRRAGGKP